MNNSSQLNEILGALSQFQGELESASKDKQGHGYKYADLAECINTAKPVLLKHGLSVTQMLGMSDGGKQTLITMLGHMSGQFISSETELPPAVLQGGAGKNPVQVLGSAITYMRRYAYAAIIGLTQEDDDAQSAQMSEEQQQAQQKPWLNKIDDQQSMWISGQIASGKSHDDVINHLRGKYSISKAMREQIKGIQ